MDKSWVSVWNCANLINLDFLTKFTFNVILTNKKTQKQSCNTFIWSANGDFRGGQSYPSGVTLANFGHLVQSHYKTSCSTLGQKHDQKNGRTTTSTQQEEEIFAIWCIQLWNCKCDFGVTLATFKMEPELCGLISVTENLLRISEKLSENRKSKKYSISNQL